MKFKYFIIINLIMLIINSFVQGKTNYKLYKNDEARFSFKYNYDKFIIYENYDNVGTNEKINVVIQVDEISNLYEEAPFGYDKGSAISEKENLEKGKKGYGIDRSQDIELIKIDNFYGEIMTILTRDSIEDIFFERKLLFFNNNYRIIITVFGPNNKIIKANSSFFNYDKGSKSYSWVDKAGSDSFIDFFNSIKKLDKGNPALIWFNSIYEIAKEIKFINSGNIVFYQPSINNLRFRETPDLNGKYIRSLKQGEKLELIEKGKTETINGTKGAWVKVKTEKGEIGWCFDAYLEEVKKK